ncbi:unnamed protein product [Rotaria sp. Silwood2]|nr:unnamed protein product [Rotaria sp. Silwood2]CAF3908143.1 unnamed protein product [Rotaria sp. Silwood2]CAF4098909.1 unnamed protein product [Rotaria sp. Silwood2]CAF4426075.1 unnamed protein product [Rotaria sp. Silwood2]CAF4452537.1 unnamed protein product [Rotaria sp. Silwood2]
MRYSTRKRPLRSNNHVTNKSSKKLKILKENHDNETSDIVSSETSITTSVDNATKSTTSNNKNCDHADINQDNSDAEALNKSPVSLNHYKSADVSAKANHESLMNSTDKKTPRVKPVLSLAPLNHLDASTKKEHWRNQLLNIGTSSNSRLSSTPISNHSKNKNGTRSTQINTKLFSSDYDGNRASTNSLHITRRSPVRKILQNNASSSITGCASRLTGNNRSPATMSSNTRALIEGSLEYRELKRLFNEEQRKNRELRKDYALLKKELDNLRSSSIPRPSAPVVGWLEEVLGSIDEGQYQGDGRSKSEVADALNLDPISLLTVVGRTAQKTALKIFRRKYPTPRARANIGSIVEMDEEELQNIYVYARWLHRKYHYSISDMRKAIATSIRNAVNYVRKLTYEQDVQLNAIASATELDDKERDRQVQSALDNLQRALDKSNIDEDEDEDYEEELNSIED